MCVGESACVVSQGGCGTQQHTREWLTRIDTVLLEGELALEQESVVEICDRGCVLITPLVTPQPPLLPYPNEAKTQR